MGPGEKGEHALRRRKIKRFGHEKRLTPPPRPHFAQPIPLPKYGKGDRREAWHLWHLDHLELGRHHLQRHTSLAACRETSPSHRPRRHHPTRPAKESDYSREDRTKQRPVRAGRRCLRHPLKSLLHVSCGPVGAGLQPLKACRQACLVSRARGRACRRSPPCTRGRA